MASKRRNFLAVATISALFLASSALADGWWEPAPLPSGWAPRPDPKLDPALHEMVNLIVSPTSWPILFPLWAPRCFVVVQPLSNYGRARPDRPTQVCE
jgi:hypothetical protein